MNIFVKRRGSNRLVPPLLVLLAILAFAAFFLLPLWGRLTISNYREETKLLTLPVNKGESFQIAYLHSINLSPVKDTIEWTGESLTVRESWFKTFGAGIPIPADGIGEELIKVNNGYILTNINKEQESFLLMSEDVPNHHLIYRGREISLLALGGAGTLLKFEVKKVSLLTCLRLDG
ncbi:DUF1850 domain-containing protein [Eubacteriales bacterium OttesenSCG-928-K08]|nr:DUF1850 domain-containing protein [Eubacteriales bacterium OttesenSCG-928-K08]